jgi:metal-sulfur cluster biosynthetic enzyme
VARTTEEPSFFTLDDQAEVLEYVRRVADGIHDPCGMTAGVRIGLYEMGLVREVEVEADEGEDEPCWNVKVRLRLTGPGCQYFFLFKDNLEERLSAHPRISHATVDWDPSIDWTPEEMTPAARSRLDARRRSLWPSEAGGGA